MAPKPWRLLESSYVQKNIRIDQCQLSNGLIIQPLVLEYGAWVSVLAVTTQQQAVLIQQYRHGVQKVIWELPGGAVEEGEGPIEAARRELLEETGFTADEFIEIGKAYPNPASQTNTHYSVLALGARSAGAQKLDDTEEIDIALLPLEEAFEMAKRGDLPQSLHLTTLFFALAYFKQI